MKVVYLLIKMGLTGRAIDSFISRMFRLLAYLAFWLQKLEKSILEIMAVLVLEMTRRFADLSILLFFYGSCIDVYIIS